MAFVFRDRPAHIERIPWATVAVTSTPSRQIKKRRRRCAVATTLPTILEEEQWLSEPPSCTSPTPSCASSCSTLVDAAGGEGAPEEACSPDRSPFSTGGRHAMKRDLVWPMRRIPRLRGFVARRLAGTMHRLEGERDSSAVALRERVKTELQEVQADMVRGVLLGVEADMAKRTAKGAEVDVP